MNKKDIEIIKETSNKILEILAILRGSQDLKNYFNHFFSLYCLVKRIGFYSQYWGIDKCCEAIELFLTLEDVSECKYLLESIEIIALNSLEYGKNQEIPKKKL